MVDDVKIFENEEEENSLENSSEGGVIDGEIINDKWFLSAIKGDQKYLKDNAETNVGKFDMNGATALMYCANAGHLDCVKVLVNFKQELKKRDKNGNTALILATKKGYADVAKILVKYEGGIKNNEGKTALDYAIENNDEKCIKILKNAGETSEENKNSSIKEELKEENKKLEKEYKEVKEANEEIEKIKGQELER